MKTLNSIDRTVVKEFLGVLDGAAPVPLPNEGTIDLVSVSMDLTGNIAGVLLQAVVNWEALFGQQPGTLNTAGAASVSFELLRDGEIIYRVTQTATQPQANANATPLISLNRTNKTATLIHLDAEPLTGQIGLVTYTLRATNILLIPPFTIDGQTQNEGLAEAYVLSATLVAQQLSGFSRHDCPVHYGVKKVAVDENFAPQGPINIIVFPFGFTNTLPMEVPTDLASVGINIKHKKNSILLMAAVNWTAVFDIRGAEDFSLLRAGSATATFELLRNGTVIQRLTQTAPQTFVDFGPRRISSGLSAEIAALLHFDDLVCSEPSGFVTYTLRVTNVFVTAPLFSSTPPPSFTGSVATGAVTLVVQEIGTLHKRDESGDE